MANGHIMDGPAFKELKMADLERCDYVSVQSVFLGELCRTAERKSQELNGEKG